MTIRISCKFPVKVHSGVEVDTYATCSMRCHVVALYVPYLVWIKIAVADEDESITDHTTTRTIIVLSRWMLDNRSPILVKNEQQNSFNIVETSRKISGMVGQAPPTSPLLLGSFASAWVHSTGACLANFFPFTTVEVEILMVHVEEYHAREDRRKICI